MWIAAVLLAIVVVVLGYAWVDGGREPVRTITEPVVVPQPGPGGRA